MTDSVSSIIFKLHIMMMSQRKMCIFFDHFISGKQFIFHFAFFCQINAWKTYPRLRFLVHHPKIAKFNSTLMRPFNKHLEIVAAEWMTLIGCSLKIEWLHCECKYSANSKNWNTTNSGQFDWRNQSFDDLTCPFRTAVIKVFIFRIRDN